MLVRVILFFFVHNSSWPLWTICDIHEEFQTWVLQEIRGLKAYLVCSELMHPIGCCITEMGPCDRLQDGSKGLVFGGHRRDSGRLLVGKMEENRDFDKASSRDNVFPPCSSTNSRANMPENLNSSAWARSHSTSHESLRKILRILSRSRYDEQISTGHAGAPQFVVEGTDGIRECPQKNLLVFLRSKEEEENSRIGAQGNDNLWAEVGSADTAHAEGLTLRLVSCDDEDANGMGSPACHGVWKDCESMDVGSTSEHAVLNGDYKGNGLAETVVLSHDDNQSGVLDGGFESEEQGGRSTHMPAFQASDEDDHMECSRVQKEENCEEWIEAKDGRAVCHGSLELLLDAIKLASGTLFEAEDCGLPAKGTPVHDDIGSPKKQGKRCITGSYKRKQMSAGSAQEEQKDKEEGPICEKVKKTENHMLNWYVDFEDFGPLVRSKRGRNQVLPSRFRDSVLDPWKRVTRPRLKR